jgi:hypothetical protein
MRSVALSLVLALAAAETLWVAAEPRWENGTLALTMPTPGTVSADLAAQLRNGLTHRLRYTLVLHAEGESQPLLTDVLTTELVYDLWDEVFVVTQTQGGRIRRVRFKTEERARNVLERPKFRALAWGTPRDADKRLTADVHVEVNPVSQEVLDRTRQLLAPPPGDSETGATRSFLGNVVRLFINESHSSAPPLSYRARPFHLPDPGTTGGAP